MLALRELDAEGVALRKSKHLKRRSYLDYQFDIEKIIEFYCVKGPNYVWNLDGYDKLSPFGLCIHGCIDGLV